MNNQLYKRTLIKFKFRYENSKVIFSLISNYSEMIEQMYSQNIYVLCIGTNLSNKLFLL